VSRLGILYILYSSKVSASTRLYSPKSKCVEGLFSEVQLPLNGVLRSSLTPAAPFGPIFSRFGITDHDEAWGVLN
jgi:hypothetical protein